MSSQRNVGQNHNTNRSNKSFESVAQSKNLEFFWLKLAMQTHRLKYGKKYFCLLFYMGVKRGFSHWRKNTDFGVLENGVLRKIFRPKRENLARHCRECGNEKCLDVLWSPNIIPVIKSSKRWAGHVARIEDRRSTYTVLIPEGKGPLGRPRRRQDNDIIEELKSSGKAWNGLIWHWLGTSGRLLPMQQWTSAFHQVREIWLAEELLAYKEGPRSMELIMKVTNKVRLHRLIYYS